MKKVKLETSTLIVFVLNYYIFLSHLLLTCVLFPFNMCFSFFELLLP
jgi:hypothetical protein